ncbi:MAG TPA: FAD-dependent oxidoreductase [Candidatus Polarisedimenticolaceae bacterium]|nr:FAD-dependent oxidoreductase [Candidatus Polarisedimenticolaceae bacterium]
MPLGAPGSAEHPLRVAVVGSGPAAFYTVQHLFAERELACSVDMFERLPAPFGLVRYGVAPDHPKIKSVVAVYHKLAQQPSFRFFGGVDYGRHLSLADLRRHYHQVVFATGAQTDRRMGVAGEDLRGSYPATEFVAWYNGHPDYAARHFDLDTERAVVVGVGNVAVDVARILCSTPEELAATDISDLALDALRKSRVREVLLVGRRGPAQAAFTNPELKELGQLQDAEARTLAEEVELDPHSRAALGPEPDKATVRKLELLAAYAAPPAAAKGRRLWIRFLVSPTELVADEHGRVGRVRLVHNELYRAEDGSIRPRATERFETIEAGLVFRSVGYKGVPLADLPFDAGQGLVPNRAGRVFDPATGAMLPATYVAGWIKRGPSGVIGTNKPDAEETVAAMLGELGSGELAAPAAPEPEAIERLLQQRGVRWVSYSDWLRLDALEVSRGKAQNRPRVKLLTYEAFNSAREA